MLAKPIIAMAATAIGCSVVLGTATAPGGDVSGRDGQTRQPVVPSRRGCVDVGLDLDATIVQMTAGRARIVERLRRIAADTPAAEAEAQQRAAAKILKEVDEAIAEVKREAARRPGRR